MPNPVYPDSAVETEKQSDETFWSPDTWAPVTVFTMVLAVVGIGQAFLFFWQFGYLKSADETARIAANAAKSAAETASSSLRDLERPHLFIEVVPFLRAEERFGENYASVEFILANHGRFPADIVRCSVDTYNGHPFSEERTWPNRIKFCSVLGVGETVRDIQEYIPADVAVRFAGHDLAGIPTAAFPERNQFTTFFRIEAIYKGASNTFYKSLFIWYWDHGPNHWVILHKERT